MEIDRDARIYIAGHRGMVGSAIWRRLESRGFRNLFGRTRRELDLLDYDAVTRFYEEVKPDYVFVAAAKVGGIVANQSLPASFLYENLQIQNHLIHGAWVHGVRKLLFLGSSCIYPKLAPQPIREDYLLTGELEPTNEPYAIAKIAGIKMCQAYQRQYGCRFISAMPTNLYGPNDNYDPEYSHVLPALIRRFHEARESGAERVTCWGSGTPRREFLHVDDLAAACLLLMEEHEGPDIVNVGCGSDISIGELSLLVARVVGYQGEIEWDTTKPDGTPRKLLDYSRLFDLGWRPRIGLEEGIASAHQDFQDLVSVPR